MTAATVTASPAPVARFDPADAPTVSIVMVTYGTGPVLVDSLASIGRAGLAAPRSFEIVVVDNPHPVRDHRTADEVRLFTAGVRLVEPAVNTGFGGGCELGALHARGRFLAFVNPDVIVERGWLEPLVDTVEAAPDPTIACAVLLDPDGTVQEAGQRLRRNMHTRARLDPPADDDTAEVDYASAACWVMCRDHHESVGGFDPAYHPAYFEDVDLAWRVKRSGGHSVVVGASRVIHHRGLGAPGATSPANAQRAVFAGRWPEVAWLGDD